MQHHKRIEGPVTDPMEVVVIQSQTCQVSERAKYFCGENLQFIVREIQFS